MDDKKSIRRSFYLNTKKKYHEVSDNFFFFLKKNLEPRIKNKKKNISLYYPTSYELNILKIFEIKFFKRFNFLLPVIEDKNVMNFYPWKTNDILNAYIEAPKKGLKTEINNKSIRYWGNVFLKLSKKGLIKRNIINKKKMNETIFLSSVEKILKENKTKAELTIERIKN